jgi:sensor domain CHASE-containing protein
MLRKVRCVTPWRRSALYTSSGLWGFMFDGVRIMSNEIADLPLQRKVALTLLLVFAAFSLLSYTILTTVIAPTFDEIDLSTARTNLIRAERAIQSDIENLAAMTSDWALWDDIHDYVRGVNPGFKKSNLDRPTLTNLGLDLMAVYAVNDELLWSQVLVDGSERDIGELGIFGPGDRAAPLLASHAETDDRSVGILQTGLGPVLITSMPILRTDDSGPIAGAVIMGQFMNASRLARLNERTEVDFEWHTIASFSRDHGMDPSSISQTDIHLETADSAITSFITLSDIFAEPLLVLDAHTPRRIAALGGRTVDAAMLFLVITGVFVTIVIWYLLRDTILRPI